MADEARTTEPIPLGAKLWGAGLCLMLLAGGTGIATNVLMLSFDSMATVAIGSIEGVERLGGIEIPENARLVGACLRHSMMDLDPPAWAVLEMPRDGARKMLRTRPLVAPDYDGPPVSDDWKPCSGKLREEWHQPPPAFGGRGEVRREARAADTAGV